MNNTTTLYHTIRTDMATAIKARDGVRLTVLRSLLTLCTHEMTAGGHTPRDTPSDDDMVALVRRSIKQRRDAAEQFRHGGRADLADNEDAEATVLEAYLPPQATDEEVIRIIHAEMDRMNAHDRGSTGKLTGAVMGILKGRADGTRVRHLVEGALT